MSADLWDVSFENHDPRIESGSTNLSKDKLIDKIKGVIFGQAIGDAIGLATEFMNKGEAAAYYKGGVKGYDEIVQDFHRSRWQKGDWTDDTDQMILILASLVNSNGRPLCQDLAKRLVLWMKKGFPDLGDVGGMGIGMTTHRTLTQPMFISDPHKTARDVWQASGCYLAPNGAVMRTSILGVVNFDDMRKVIYQTSEMCHVTHADPRCLASCITVTAAIALMLQGKYDLSKKKELEKLIGESCQIAKEVALSGCSKDQLKEFDRHVSVEKLHSLHLDDAKTIGYTYKALGAGVHGLRYGKDFKKAIVELVMEAGDADSNASVCGALLGCKLGYSSLPPDLLGGLVHKSWLDNWVDRLLSMMGLENEAVESSSTQPGESPPAQPRNSPPAQPGDSPPAQPCDSPPAQPGGSPPAQPGDSSPAQHEDSSPAQLGDSSPAQPEDSSPAQPEDSSPAQPEDSSPAQPEGRPPAQPEGSPPAQPDGTPSTQQIDAGADGDHVSGDARTDSDVTQMSERPAPEVPADTAEVGREVDEDSHVTDSAAQ